MSAALGVKAGLPMLHMHRPDPDVVRLYLATLELVSQLSLVHPDHSALLRLELVRAHDEFTAGRTSDEEFAGLVGSIASRCLEARPGL